MSNVYQNSAKLCRTHVEAVSNVRVGPTGMARRGGDGFATPGGLQPPDVVLICFVSYVYYSYCYYAFY